MSETQKQDSLTIFDFTNYSTKELLNLKKQVLKELQKREEKWCDQVRDTYSVGDRIFSKYALGHLRFGVITQKNFMTARVLYDDGAEERVSWRFIQKYHGADSSAPSSNVIPFRMR